MSGYDMCWHVLLDPGSRPPLVLSLWLHGSASRSVDLSPVISEPPAMFWLGKAAETEIQSHITLHLSSFM
jgi:hypothetical protein